MRFPDDAPVTPAKLEELRARVTRLGIDLGQIEERAVLGSGPGGQKVNKTSSTVQLSYPPLELAVSCREARSRALNRYLALRRLTDAVEEKLHPGDSAVGRRRDRIRKQKERRRRRGSSESGTGS